MTEKSNLIIEKSHAILNGLWDERFSQQLKNNNILSLELNQAKGWNGDNIEFLREINNLKCLVIIDYSLKNLSALESLTNLERLTLLTYAETPIDFNKLPNLIECEFEWIHGSGSIFFCAGLQKLMLNCYSGSDFTEIANLYNLQSLQVFNSRIKSLKGIEKLRNLKSLTLRNLKQLTSISTLCELKGLKELELYSCKKIENYSCIFELHHLTKLNLLDQGPIRSLSGIENLIELEQLVFFESTNILDGDLSALLNLKKLVNVAFQNRKHYNLKRENLPQWLT